MTNSRHVINTIQKEIDKLETQMEIYDLRIELSLQHHNQALVDTLKARQKACAVQLLVARDRLEQLRSGVSVVEAQVPAASKKSGMFRFFR